MGNPKQKWTPEEEEALRAGVAKHGTGKWKNIQKDPEFNHFLYSRSNIDLKDKWRNMSVSANGQGPREKSRTPKPKNNIDSPATPLAMTQAPGSSALVVVDPVSTDVHMDDASKCLLDGKTASKYNAMIYEALSTLKDPNGSDTSAIVSFIEKRHEVPQNFRRLLSSRLRRLVSQEKLEKVQNCYRLRREVLNGTKGPIPKPKEIRPRLSGPINSYLGETLEEAAVAAAYKVAEAENKSFVAAEAVKEAERVSRMAEEAEAFLQLAKEIYERFNHHPIMAVEAGDCRHWDEDAYRDSILEELESNSLTVFRSVFSPSSSDQNPNFIVAASSDGSVASYSLSSLISSVSPGFGNSGDQNLSVAEPICLLHGHDGPAYDVKFYGDGEDSLLLSCGDDGRIRGWKWMDILEANQNSLPQGSHKLKSTINYICICFNFFFSFFLRGPWGALSPIPETNAIAVDTQGGSIYAAAGDSHAYCWDVEKSKIKMAFKGHAGYLHSVVARNSCNQIITGSEDGTARIWDCRSGKCTNVIEPGKDRKPEEFFSYVSCIALDANEKWLACGSGRNLSVWNLSASERISAITTRACIQDICFDDNQILAVGAEPVLSRYDTNGVMISQIQCIPRSTFSVSLHSSGIILVAGYGGVVDVISQFGSHLCSFRFMAGAAPEGSQFDTRQFDSKMNELLSTDGQDFFTSYDEVYDSFDAMGLQENLLRGIYAYGFEKPSAIQQRGIVPFTKGLDVIQQAQSGTGKTATFCSGILQQLDYNVVECQALVLAPTRELAQQIEKVMRALGDYLGVKVHACVGGTSVREDQRILSAGVHVVVGTPGRVFDMLRRQALRADYIKMFVLDEADEMLSRGFKDQMRSRDHTVSATHGDMDQNTRDIIMREFRSGSSRVLITTDLLARGIDVQQVSLEKVRVANGIRYPSSPSRKRWILGVVRIDPCSAVANALSIPPGRNMTFKLSSELVDAAKGSGNAIHKREETHRMAEANRAFAHFRRQIPGLNSGQTVKTTKLE
ncbi:hypothetical protein E3N88_00020 [Mikania micrantha]|uniref:MYB transcription factor n=1 Tax=Mikania micrantha TaxID=192012 RepID=A0A5N6PWV8_9ASTR|nr:hypothetical protein E3N88_00020 [Mikania micrantha]